MFKINLFEEEFLVDLIIFVEGFGRELFAGSGFSLISIGMTSGSLLFWSITGLVTTSGFSTFPLLLVKFGRVVLLAGELELDGGEFLF